MTTLRQLIARARADAVVLAAIFLVVAVSSFLAAATPRWLNETYDRALRQTIASAPAEAQEVLVSVRGAIDAHGGRTPAGGVEAVSHELLSGFPLALQDAIRTRTWAASTGRYVLGDAVTGEAISPGRFLYLRVQSEVDERVRYVAGQAPQRRPLLSAGTALTARGPALHVEVALSSAAAQRSGLAVGERFVARPDPQDNDSFTPLVVEISGVFEPDDPAASYWTQDSRILEPGREVDDEGGDRFVAVGITSADAYADVLQATTPGGLRYAWRYPLDTAALNASNVDGVIDALASTGSGVAIASAGSTLFPGRQPVAAIQAGLAPLVEEFRDQRNTASAVIAIVGAGVFGIALAVGALLVQLTADRRRLSTGLTVARGASSGRVLAGSVAEALIVTVPAGIAGWLIARAVLSARPSVLSVVLAGLVVASVAALLPAMTWSAGREAFRSQRRDLGVRSVSPRRLAIEGLLVALAVVGLLLVRRRGIAAGTNDVGVDPFLVAVPLLLGGSVAILAVRAYPWPLRMLAGASSRRRGGVAFLGLTRAGREGVVAVLPLIALLIAMAISVFAGVVTSTVREGQTEAIWRQVGADVVVRSGGFEPAQVEAVSNTAGVSGVIEAIEDGDALLTQDRSQRFRAVALDTAAYDQLLAFAPAAPVPPALLDQNTIDGRIPVAVSPNLAAQAVEADLELEFNGTELPARVVATADRFVGVRPGADFVAMDIGALREVTERRWRPATLFVVGPSAIPDAVRAAATAPGALVQVTTLAEAEAQIREAPLVAGTLLAFRAGIAIAAGYSILTVAMVLLLTAEARTRFLSYLRTLGLGSRQLRGLVVLELAPLVGIALVAGVLTGIAIPLLLGGGLDLAPFTGGQAPVLHVDIGLTATLAIGLLLIVAAAIMAAAALSRRRNLGTVVRVGDEA
jgi:putative ABC transport system permease protein